MSSKTTFWLAIALTLAVVRSAASVPTTMELDELPKVEGQKPDSPPLSGEQIDPKLSAANNADASVPRQKEQTADKSDSPEVPAAADAGNAVRPADVTGTTQPGPDAAGPNSPVVGPDTPSNAGPKQPVTGNGYEPRPHHDKKKVQSNRVQTGGHEHYQYPYPHYQQPQVVVFDSHKILSQPPRDANFFQLMNAFNNMMRTPEVAIAIPERNYQYKAPAIPPIPLLLSVMLNAFQQQPTDLITSFNENFPKLNDQNSTNMLDGLNKPVINSTVEEKGDYIVKTNNTSYTSGDPNHKVFYYFQQVQVLPKATNNKKTTTVGSHNVATTENVSETQKTFVDREQEPSGTASSVDQQQQVLGENKPQFEDKTSGIVPIAVHHRSASAYATYAGRPHDVGPHGKRDGVRRTGTAGKTTDRPDAAAAAAAAPGLPVDLSNDTLVNELAEAKQQASGKPAVLPLDVEIFVPADKPSKARKPDRGDEDGDNAIAKRNARTGGRER